MQGLGNDFVVINNLTQSIVMNASLAKRIADRRLGVGCDQVLLIEPPRHADADFYYRIFNADGSEVYQCGNGARCVGLFIQSQQLSAKKTVCLETKRSLIDVTVLDNLQVQVSMGKPSFDPASLPYVGEQKSLLYKQTIFGNDIYFDLVSLGNPHCIMVVDDFNTLDIESVAAYLDKSQLFPEGVNVGFVKVTSRAGIDLRVVERGAGLTQACGSGACAAVVCGRRQGLLDAVVTVSQAGGDLEVRWDGGVDNYVLLSGPAVAVFEGVFATIF